MDQTRTIKKLIIGLIGASLLINFGIALFLYPSSRFAPQPAKKNTQQVIAVPTVTPVSYTGEAGKDALTLLQNKTTVKQDKSGLVVTIGSKTADLKKREFWAFYVNGKFASVGPKDYVTQDTDKIEWKIDHY